MGGPDQILELAKSMQRTMAAEAFHSSGFRLDAVFYCLAALQKYAELSPEKVRETTFEIGLKGRLGLNVNNPQRLPGSRGKKTFFALSPFLRLAGGKEGRANSTLRMKLC